MKSRSFYAIIVLALLLSLIGSAVTVTPARAASFNVATPDDLITAITTANSNGQNDTITLTANITLLVANNGNNGLPIITGDGGNTLTINGNGFTLARSSAVGTPNFRIIEVANGANLTLQDITISNGSISNNFGGAILNWGVLNIINSTFNGNSISCELSCLSSGGAISNRRTLSITNSTFHNNVADGNGGAVYNFNSTTIITNSVFFQNSADREGGSIYNDSEIGSLIIANSTIADNTAVIRGGGIFNRSGTLTSTNNTFFYNDAMNGMNLYYYLGTVELKNTILFTPFANVFGRSNCGGPASPLPYENPAIITIGADNLATDTTCESATLVTPTMLRLSSTLANNGGPTQTIALNSGSVAINAGDAAVCPATDQRGITRPQGAGCDIGAYEFVPSPPPTITLAVYDASAGTLTVTGSDLLANGSGSDIIANKFTLTGEGSATYTLTNTPNVEISSSTSFTLTLSDTDRTAANLILNKNGTTSIDGTIYNLAAADEWNSEIGNTDISDATNGATVSNVEADAPTIISQTLLANYTGTGPNSFTITFSEDVYNPTGDTLTDDVTNPNNFLLIEKGVNGVTDTISCAGGDQSDDIKVKVDSVIYVNPTAIVTLTAPLPVGSYRLFICGTTSIIDLAGNAINRGLSDYTFDFVVTNSLTTTTETEEEGKFTASALPKTGFAPKTITTLPPQPAMFEYAKLGDLWIEIPNHNVKSNIVGVPQNKDNTWDVTWLGNDTGWLNGTAFPTWTGNSVLTAHVTNASGVEGPFAALKSLKYGDQIIVHMGGAQYIYEVRNSRLARPYSTSYAFESLQDHSYLTLITCQGYNPLNESYLFRRVVRAVLVEVK